MKTPHDVTTHHRLQISSRAAETNDYRLGWLCFFLARGRAELAFYRGLNMTEPILTIADQILDRAGVMLLAVKGVPVHLLGCELDDADLSDMILNGWIFETCLFKKTKFTSAKLERAQFIGCKGAHAHFVSTILIEAQFTACDFNNSKFSGATITQAVFRRCKLTGANFDDTKALDVTFEDCRLNEARLRNFSFRKMTLKSLDLHNAELQRCDFRDVTFEDCSLRDADLKDARFEGADLRGTDIGGVRLEDARRFKGATISRSQAAELLSELGLHVR